MTAPHESLIALVTLPTLQLLVDLAVVLREGPLVVEVLAALVTLDTVLMTDLVALVNSPARAKT